MKWGQKKYHIRQIISTFLLVLFVTYYVDITFFEHTHIINGVTIVHSHFHNSAHEKTPTGGHTTTEITLIAINSLFQSFENFLTKFDTSLFLVLCGIILVHVETKDIKSTSDLSFLRAPPIC